MAVQFTFDKCREIFKTLGTLKQKSGKIYFHIKGEEVTVGIENATMRPASAVLEYAASTVSSYNSYNRELPQFRTQITMKMKECLTVQIAQTGEKKLDSNTVTNLTKEINEAIEGLTKLKDEQYKADADKSGVIDRIISDDFQPLVDQMNPSAAALSSSGSASPASPQRPAKDNTLISIADLPTELQRLKTLVIQLSERVERLEQRPPSLPPSSYKENFMVILIALNVIALATYFFNFFQEG